MEWFGLILGSMQQHGSTNTKRQVQRAKLCLHLGTLDSFQPMAVPGYRLILRKTDELPFVYTYIANELAKKQN